MKILYTAFKGTYNASFQLVSQLSGYKLFLTNSFQGLEKDISLIDMEYDTIYMFGIDKNLRNSIKVETCANYNGELLETSFDIVTLEKAIKDLGISCIVSNKPSAYLCNAAYYYMLKKNRNTVFIHIPSIKGMNNSLMNILLHIV